MNFALPSADVVPSRFPLKEARVIASDHEAIAVAKELALQIAPGSIERDRSGTLPLAELEALGSSGLLALLVPRDHGGAGVSWVTLTEVIRILSAADSSIGQLQQNHNQFVHSIVELGTESQKRFFFDALLSGARFGNAISERGTRHPLDLRTTLTPDPDGGYRVTGQKFYATGAYTAQWIPVFAKTHGLPEVEDGTQVVLYVPRDAEGISAALDWTAFGQRSTVSGTVSLNNVHVEDEWVLKTAWTNTDPSTNSAAGQIIHTAIDVGIAEAALAEAGDLVSRYARPYWETGFEKATQDPDVISLFGRLRVQLDAATALLNDAAKKLDRAEIDKRRDNVDAARLAVAGAKAFISELVLSLTTAIFDVGGASGADARFGLDRHWRNARTHTLHDPARWKYRHIGNFLINGIAPAPDNQWI
jgi:SfnB family sulfur acquisition oxidoreductase